MKLPALKFQNASGIHMQLRIWLILHRVASDPVAAAMATQTGQGLALLLSLTLNSAPSKLVARTTTQQHACPPPGNVWHRNAASFGFQACSEL